MPTTTLSPPPTDEPSAAVETAPPISTEGVAAPMGDNLENPQAASASQVGGQDGVAPEPDPAKANPANETSDELLADKSHQDAELHLLRQRVAIAEDDLRKARKESDDQRGRIATWQDAFGLPDATDPKDKVRETIARADASAKRVADLQTALGVGDDGDAKEAVARLRAPAASKAGTLPPFGQLLLLTQLAKHHPTLGQRYFGTPDTIQEPNGDQWMALRQESLQEDETMGHVVVIQHVPAVFSYEEARSRTLQLQSDLASALRNRTVTTKNAAVNLTPVAKDQAQERQATAERRVKEIEEAIEALKPRLEPPKITEWRFTVDLDGYEPVDV